MKKNWTDLEQIIDASPSIVWITESDGSCSYISKQWYRMTGQAEPEALGTGWLKAVHPDDIETVRNEFAQATQKGVGFTVEYRVLTMSGGYRWVVDLGNPRRAENGAFLGYSGTVYDVHEQRLSRKEIELKSDALENSLDGFDIVDYQGRFVYANQAYLRMWRYDNLEDLKRSTPASHCADPTIPGKIISEIRANGQCTIEFVAKRKDGTFFDVLMSARLAHDADGNEIYPTSSVDITKKKHTEQQLRASEEALNLITNAIPSLIGYIDKNQVYRFANLAYEKKMGLRVEDMVGRHIKDIWSGYYDKTRPNIERALKGQKVHTQNLLIDKNGDDCFLDIKYIPDISSKGEVRGFVVIGHDISDLVKAKESAERANQLKSSFLANMSHEIRTPLSALLGFTDLLRDPHLSDAEKYNYLSIMEKNGEQLSVIINDILDLSKVEAGHLTLEFQEVNLQTLVEEVISFLSLRANEKNLELGFKISKSVPESIVTDPVRARQVLLNLVGNAVKFTLKGEVRLRVYNKPEDKDLTVYFEIQDTGIGIPEDKQERVFEVFVQADNSMTRQFGGTGLGLPLSKKLALALGGDVKLDESQVGTGTKMLFTLESQPERLDFEPRLNQVVADSEKEIDPEVFRDVKILVAEDVPDNQFLISHYLTSMGAQVEFANNGREAYDLAIKNDYALVLMDIQMPEMDGYTATSKLRIAGFSKPIIALTAHAMNEVRNKCLNVGCSDYLSKPINLKELKKVVGRHLLQ